MANNNNTGGGTWHQMHFPSGVQDQHRIFENSLADAVQQFRRLHEDEFVRSPALMDASLRHLVRHILLRGGNFPSVSSAEKLNYLDDRIRMLRHDVKSNYGFELSPNSFGWCLFMARVLLVRIAASTTSRQRLLAFALERYEMMKRLTGCWDDIIHAIRGAWRPEYSAIVSLVVLHHGLRNVGTVPKAESCGSWCMEGPNDPRLIYQLEHPSLSVDLDTAYQAVVSPQAAQDRTVHNSLLLLHALHAGEWLRFLELCCVLDLTFFQKCYAFGCLTYARFRAVADTFGRPRAQQKPRLRDYVTLQWLSEKLLFASEEDCVSFLNDLGLAVVRRPKQKKGGNKHTNNNNNTTNAHDDLLADDEGAATAASNNNDDDGDGTGGEMEDVILMQAGDEPSAPTAVSMLERIREKKNKDGMHEWGLYPPHEEFFNLDKAMMMQTGDDDKSSNSNPFGAAPAGATAGPQLDLLLLIQQPDGSEQYLQRQQSPSQDGNENNNNNATSAAARSFDDVDEWADAFSTALDPHVNPFSEGSNIDRVLPRAPSLVGADIASKLAAFDALIDHERSRLFSNRLQEQLLREFESTLVLDLEEEMARCFSALHIQEREERASALAATQRRVAADREQQKLQQEQELQKKRQKQQESKLAATGASASAMNLANPFAGAISSTTTAPSSESKKDESGGGWAGGWGTTALAAASKSKSKEQQQQQQQEGGDEEAEEDEEEGEGDESAGSSGGPSSVASTAPPSPFNSAAAEAAKKKKTFDSLSTTTTTAAAVAVEAQPRVTFAPVLEEKQKLESVVQQKPEAAATVHQQQQQQKAPAKRVVFDPALGAYRWIDPDSSSSNNRLEEQPFIDQHGYTTWASRLVAHLRAMYLSASVQQLASRGVPHSSSSSSSCLSALLPELSQSPTATEILREAGLGHLVGSNDDDDDDGDSHLRSLIRGQLRGYTQKLQWCVAVVSDERADCPRSVTASCLALFHDPETATKPSNPDDDIKSLCFRTFLHNSNNDDDQISSLITTPPFNIAASNIRSTELHRAPEIIAAASHGGSSCGVFAVFVEPPRASTATAEASTETLAAWLERLLKSFSGSKKRGFSACLRGIVILADCNNNGNQAQFEQEENLWYDKLAAVWKKVASGAGTEATKTSNNSGSGGGDDDDLDSVSLLRLLQSGGSGVRRKRSSSKSSVRPAAVSASDRYWVAPLSGGDDDNSDEAACSSLCSFEEDLPSLVVVPSRQPEVRRSMGTAIASALETVAAVAQQRLCL